MSASQDVKHTGAEPCVRRAPLTLPAMTRPDLHRGLNRADAHELASLWQGLPPPQAVITSPPYLDMHDYGNASPIGVPGQSLSNYMSHIEGILRDCHWVTATNATLWLVVGSVRRNGRLIALPNKLINCAENVGWTLREAVTWDKQKALPWTHHGELRDVTEEVLLFSKTNEFQFDASDLRSPIPNSIWWRRYPERYSPNGAMPTNLWSIPIPTQGSWAGIRSHLCPFPEELTYRMLSLTTIEGDTVLDPFAGIGSVPAMAEAMGRVGYGLELTDAYVDAYTDTAASAKRFLMRIERGNELRTEFGHVILELRLLKFAKNLGRSLERSGIPILCVEVEKSDRVPKRSYQIASAKFRLAIQDPSTMDIALALAHDTATRPPLSKFGIDAEICAIESETFRTDGFWYEHGAYWNQPSRDMPTVKGPHVLADFVPDPDQIDDTPYA